MARIYLSNLGCKLNQAEVEAYSRRFESDGHVLVSELAEADLHVVNTCTVTHMAARDSRKLARRASRVSETCRTVLTGCYATEQPKAAAELDGVSAVIGERSQGRSGGACLSAVPGPRACGRVQPLHLR